MRMNSDVVFLDLEADGLNPSKIHCIVCKHRGKVDVFTDRGSFAEYVAARNAAVFVAHNGISYDYPVIRRLYDVSIPPERGLDSLVLSRLSDPSRSGGHSLAAWGAFLGFPKGDYSGGWDTYNPEMLEYCKRDVEVLEKVWGVLQEELKEFGAESLELEHEVARIIDRQVKHGWLFRTGEAIQLHSKLKERLYELEEQVRSHFIPLPTFVKQITPKVKKDGTLSTVGLKFLGDDWTTVGGTFSRVDFPQFNLGSRQQIGKYLQHFGWKPKKFTETGQPMVDEKILADVRGIPEASMIAEYLMVQKRIAMVQAWLEATDDTNRVHGRVRSNGAVTGRMTHDSPNLAQVPACRAPYGEECRALWTVPEGFLLVGADASGLELRMLAHYMDDENYVRELLGGDIHTANQRAAGLPDRNAAKTFIYAFLYGAGDAKIGAIVGGDKQTGRELKERFLSNTPSLKRLRERVERASGRGYVKGLDGRHIHIRSSHAALNSLLQGAGAIVMKKAIVIMDKANKDWKLKAQQIATIHDEYEFECPEHTAEKVAHFAVASIVGAGMKFNLRCPLDAEAKIGKTWAEVH
jgi:DNA polymerase-1